MRLNGGMSLCVATLVAAVSTLTSASAFGGLFDGSVLKNLGSRATSESVDDSFFPGQALTIGDLSLANGYATSEVGERYGECASCAGQAAEAAPVFVDDFGYGVAFDGFAYDPGFATFDYGWTTFEQPRKPIRSALRGMTRPVANVLRGVKDFLFGYRYSYCQPAYVCDPCWSVCDPCWSPCAVDVCDPCAISVCDPCAVPTYGVCAPCGVPACLPCAANVVYAPRSCCGDGFAPGEVNEIDPATGKGVNSRVNASDSAAATTPKSLSTEDSTAPATPVSEPAEPQGGLNDGLNDGEPVPTPPANPTIGSGVIKMLVPDNAVVFVNGYRTKQKGALRSFVARDLEYGETYTFEIRVVENRDGQVYEDVQTTILGAGETSALAFNPTLKSNEAFALNR